MTENDATSENRGPIDDEEVTPAVIAKATKSVIDELLEGSLADIAGADGVGEALSVAAMLLAMIHPEDRDAALERLGQMIGLEGIENNPS